MTSIASTADMGLYLTALLTGALLLPLISAVVLIGAGRPMEGASRHHHIARVIVGITTLCLLGLLRYADYDVQLPVWLPSAGPMGLHLGGLGGQAAAVTAAALLAGLLTSPPESRMSSALFLIALSAANVSFLAGDFLTRYGALEILGLAIALAPLVEVLPNGMRKAKEVYLFLRLGDAGLLIAILILVDAGGTLAIAEALEAGARLSGPPLSWVTAGMLAAVSVKMAAWPFHRWSTAHDLSPLAGAWLYGLVMPNLGLYLLYRVTPLLTLNPDTGRLILGLSILGTLAATGQLLNKRAESPRHVAITAALGCSALGVAAAGRPTMLAGLLLVATPLRLVVWLPMRGKASPTAPIGDTIERRSPDTWLLRLAQGVHLAVEDRILQQGVTGLWRTIVGTARLWYHVGEQDGVRQLVWATARGAFSVSHGLQRIHTGRLRRNLQWVMIGMAAIVAFMVVTGW